MDISKASNFERFVFDLLGRDGARTKALFGDAIASTGRFDLSGDPAFAQAASRYGFSSGQSTHAQRLATMWAPEKAIGIKALADEAYQIAAMQNVETSAFYISPGISGYYRT